MEVDGGEISLAFSGRTRDSGFDLISNRSGITSFVFGGINEQDFLTDSEDWIYNNQRME